MTQPATKPDVVTTVRLTADQHERLKALAEREHRSVSGEVRRMIEQYLGQAVDPDREQAA